MSRERILITGTTSGIGRALLAHYTAEGAEVIAVNRRHVPQLEAMFPTASFVSVDVRSRTDVAKLVATLADTDALPDVFILNAGINAVDNDETFDLTVFRDVLETNLLGIVNFVGPLTSLARRPGPCHVIAISSMASFAGNPYGLGYHVSKRALTSCFATWARMYDGTDLVFQQVMLGPVRTPMYDMAKRLPRWMAWGKRALTVSPESTARAIARLARTRTTKLYFPKRAALPFFGMWFAQSVLEILFLGRKTLAGASRRSAVSAHDRRGEGSP